MNDMYKALCEKCPGSGGYLLNTGGKACANYRAELGYCDEPTNADYVRSADDEQLADVLLKADFCELCVHFESSLCRFAEHYPGKPLKEGCKSAAVKWLKQPYNKKEGE